MERTWSIRDVAAAAGRSAELASRTARAGLLPHYSARSFRHGARIPAHLAEPFALLLRTGVTSARLSAQMRDDPAAVLAAAEALATLARSALDAPRLTDDEAA